jgi:membrane-bound lytic murein transglycosylase D
MNPSLHGPAHKQGTRGSRWGVTGRTAWALVASLAASACGGASAAHQARPESMWLAAHAIVRPVLYEGRLAPERVATPELPFDEILASPVLADPDFQVAVGRWVQYWSTEAVEAVPVFLSRMESYEVAIDSALEANELPPSLRYLPFIESGYNPRATSVARAVGMWQFMESTARGLGMQVSRLEDERRDPIRATEGAVEFLSELRTDLGSWFLALAAYNGGPNRVRRVMNQYGRGAEPSDSLFWALRRRFPRETQEFVPKLIGAYLVASRPGAYGIERAEPVGRFDFDEVTVPDATTLDVVARAAESSQEEIERLNPQFVRGMTPPGRPSGLRVPRGSGPTFEQNYAEIPPDERVTFLEHRIEAGETLSHIARRYGVLVADLNAANPGLRARYLKIGAVLTVPVAPSVRSTSAGG